MHAVRRALGTAGLTALLLLAPAGGAFAATPTPDPSATATATATATASATPTPAPSPSATTAPSPSDTASPSAEPTSGCEQNPEICQSGGVPASPTTDCGQIGPGGEPASPPPPGVVCIAGGLNPGTTTSGSGAGAPQELPRTGPAPLLPAATVGAWLLLLGVLAAVAGRRRTARI